VLDAFLSNVETDMQVGNLVAIMPGIALYGNSGDGIERLVIDRDSIVYVNDMPTPNQDIIQPWVDEHMK
jgi:hypothetical protein